MPSAESYRCPPRSAEAYARLVGEIARRERGIVDVWQVLNEPNNRFVFSGDVIWTMVLVMAPASLLGGVAGGRLVNRIKPEVLRAVVVTYGTLLAIYYLAR